MKPEMKGKAKFGVWGIIIGAIVVMTIGFAWGGWTTQSTAQKMSDEAVLASQAAICVAQFMKEPSHEAKLKEIEKIDSWKRSEFIEKGGWDKMPGQEKAGSLVAQACAKGVEVLISK
jgi:predicted phage tail protein